MQLRDILAEAALRVAPRPEPGDTVGFCAECMGETPLDPEGRSQCGHDRVLSEIWVMSAIVDAALITP